ncbi:MAG: DNA/RNA nuclease SfsA [Thermodesulfobacteriota bacterium]
MKFPAPLLPAVLERRYKRFLADVRLADGRPLTVHCPNSGRMLGCDRPGSPVLLSVSDNPRRRYAHTLEMVEVGDTWVGVNTARTNDIVLEGILAGAVESLREPAAISREVRVSSASRLDFRLDFRMGRSTYLEVKNCSLAVAGTALFPDAVTARGTRHLRELIALKDAGHRAMVLFCVQRNDAIRFMPAVEIDPGYAAVLAEASRRGVEIVALRAAVSPGEIVLAGKLPVTLS